MTMWDRCKRYINKHKVGEIIARPDYLRYLYQGPPPRHSTYGTGGDNYRRILSKLGILEIVGRGKYKILSHIKQEVTATQVKEIAYSNTWKEWFINIRAEE